MKSNAFSSDESLENVPICIFTLVNVTTIPSRYGICFLWTFGKLFLFSLLFISFLQSCSFFFTPERVQCSLINGLCAIAWCIRWHKVWINILIIWMPFDQPSCVFTEHHGSGRFSLGSLNDGCVVFGSETIWLQFSIMCLLVVWLACVVICLSYLCC